MSRLYIVTLLFNLYVQYIMRNTRLDEAQAGIKTARRNTNNLMYADNTTLIAEREVKGSEVKVTQLCPTLCDPTDCSWNSPGQNIGVGSLSLLQGIFPTQGSNPGLPHCRQTLYQLSHQGSPRILEWVAYSFSSRSS